MNLGQYIAQQLLEAGDKETIALFPGAFKPPHKGHFEVVQQLLDKADQVVVLVSPKTRDGVDADESVAIWELYKTLLNSSVEVKLTEESPIREVYNVVKNNPDTNFILAAGKGEVDRFKSALQFPNVEIFDAGILAGEDVNATGLRNAIKINSKTEIEKYLPKGINTDDFINILEIQPPTLNEGRLTESQTGTIGEFIKFAAKNLGIQNLPGSLTLSYDNKQAQDKRTFGFFDPNNKKIWIYVKNRNMADILRTLAHELVHRKQEEDGRLDIKSGETGSPIEDEANATAGVLLRNFGKINNSIYEGVKKNLNELDFNLNKSYDWKFEGGPNNRYTFTTGQTDYEVFYAPKKEANTYERSFRPVDEDNMFVGSVPLTPVNEFKVLEVYATVMETTIDFLNKNKDWRKVIISPIEKRRYNIVKGFLEKHLPKNYFIDEEDEIFYIYRKTK